MLIQFVPSMAQRKIMSLRLESNPWPTYYRSVVGLQNRHYFLCVSLCAWSMRWARSTGHAQGKGCEKIHAPPLPSHMTRVPHLPRSYYWWQWKMLLSLKGAVNKDRPITWALSSSSNASHWVHLNCRICVITIAPSHPLLRCEQITNVNFQVSTKVNRLDNKVSGKGKKGAQHLQPDSLLCEVTCSSGTKYSLYRYEG